MSGRQSSLSRNSDINTKFLASYTRSVFMLALIKTCRTCAGHKNSLVTVSCNTVFLGLIFQSYHKHPLGHLFYTLLVNFTFEFTKVSNVSALSVRFRFLCNKIINHKMFDHVVLVIIFLNCITIAMERPRIDPNSAVSLRSHLTAQTNCYHTGFMTAGEERSRVRSKDD